VAKIDRFQPHPTLNHQVQYKDAELPIMIVYSIMYKCEGLSLTDNETA